MGLLLNGSTQWVTLGTGVNIANTRPISFAVLYDSTNLRTAGAYGTLLSQGRVWYGSGSGGWSLLVEAAAAPRLELGLNYTGAGNGSSHSTFTTTPNTGIHLAAGVIYDNGSNTRFRYFHYRYSNATFQGEAASVPSLATDANIGTSNVADPFLIGAGWTGAATEDWFPGTILWAAVFSHDLGLGGGTTLAALPQMAALIFQGPWAMADRMLGFWSFQTGSAIDLSRAATRRNGTLTGSPSYSYAKSIIVTGTPPGGVWRIIRGPAGGGGGVTVDLTSVPATAASSAVNPTVVQASLTLNLTAVVAAAVSSAVNPTVLQGSLTINATASPATAAGTAIDPTVTISGGGLTVNLASLPATATSSAVTPTVVQASVTVNVSAVVATAAGTAVTPTVSITGGGLTVNVSASPATATSSAISPTVRQASLTINVTASPASATSSAVTPTVTLSGGGVLVNVSAVPATASGTAVTPSVRLGSVTATPAAAVAVASAITPTVRQSSVTVNLAARPALAVSSALDPTVVSAFAVVRPVRSTSVLITRAASLSGLVVVARAGVAMTSPASDAAAAASPTSSATQRAPSSTATLV